MKRLFWFILAFSFWGGDVCAVVPDKDAWKGNVPLEPLDHAKLECIYYYLLCDPIRNESREYHDILLLGDSLSLWKDYGHYRLDSVIQEIGRENLPYEEFSKLYDLYIKGYMRYVLKYPGKSCLEMYDKVFLDYHIYTEPFPDFSWSLESDTLMVCGFLCRKATCSFRGREWTAWYAEDFAVSDGPWKFTGLPGLILQVEDSKREHVIRAVTLRKGGSPLRHEDHYYIPTTREKFNRSLAGYKENPRAAWGDLAPRNLDGTPAVPRHKRAFFNPMELE